MTDIELDSQSDYELDRQAEIEEYNKNNWPTMPEGE